MQTVECPCALGTDVLQARRALQQGQGSGLP